MEEMKVFRSERLSEFLHELNQLPRDYEWALQKVTRLEKLTQDYLHMLELSELSYHEKAGIAEKMKECRIDRRTAKDVTAVLEPITEFLNGERGKLLVSQLQQVLGKMRKAEKQIEQRTYTPKVLSKDDFEAKHFGHPHIDSEVQQYEEGP